MIKDKWHKMSLVEQMGNIGSEFNRMINLDRDNKEKSFMRVLELIDFTIEDKRWENRLFEILRLREIVCGLFLNKNVYEVSPGNLKKYFLYFALMANKQHVS